MEDSLQTIVIVIISIVLLFIFPVYMAYEKKDDISYILAMRYTQDFVDEVRNKGYITRDMYSDYERRLRLTGNSYDIELTHEYTRYDPITNYYIKKDGKYELVATTTQEQKEEWLSAEDKMGLEKDEQDKFLAGKLGKIPTDFMSEDTYRVSKQVYTTEHIVNILENEKKLNLSNGTEHYAYLLNEGDNFNVTIRNTNTTLATILYNSITANAIDTNTRLYVNYGGRILASKWIGEVDYGSITSSVVGLKAMKHSTSNLNIINPTDDYKVALKVTPKTVTELRAKGVLNTGDIQLMYNFVNTGDMLVSVGLNGVSILVENTTILSYPTDIMADTKIEIAVDKVQDKECIVNLYINDKKVEESIKLESVPKFGYLTTQTYNAGKYDEMDEASKKFDGRRQIVGVWSY